MHQHPFADDALETIPQAAVLGWSQAGCRDCVNCRRLIPIISPFIYMLITFGRNSNSA